MGDAHRAAPRQVGIVDIVGKARVELVAGAHMCLLDEHTELVAVCTHKDLAGTGQA